MNDVVGYLIAGVSLANTGGLAVFAWRAFRRLDTMKAGVEQVEKTMRGAVAQRAGIEIDAATARRIAETNRTTLEKLELWATRQDPLWDKR